MKQRLSLFMAAAFILLILCAPARAASSEQILFRGNEWGSSYAEVMRSFPSESKWRTLTECNFDAVESYLWDDPDAEHYEPHVGGWTNMYYGTFDKELMVAGYPVSKVNLHFAFLPEGNGLISESNPRTALIFAAYRFNPANQDDMYDNLSVKLESLYGSGFDDIKKESYFGDTKYRVWEGKDKTYVSLVSTNEGEVQIRYGYEGGNELLKQAREARILEESITDPLNVDGL